MTTYDNFDKQFDEQINFEVKPAHLKTRRSICTGCARRVHCLYYNTMIPYAHAVEVCDEFTEA